MAASVKSRRACGPSFVFLAKARSLDALKSPRNDTGIAMTNLHRSPPMNQSKTDLGIVNESQLLRFGISGRIATGERTSLEVRFVPGTEVGQETAQQHEDVVLGLTGDCDIALPIGIRHRRCLQPRCLPAQSHQRAEPERAFQPNWVPC